MKQCSLTNSQRLVNSIGYCSISGRRAEYCDEHVCLSRLSVRRDHISELHVQSSPNFVHVTHGKTAKAQSSYTAALRYVTHFRFRDDVKSERVARNKQREKG